MVTDTESLVKRLDVSVGANFKGWSAEAQAHFTMENSKVKDVSKIAYVVHRAITFGLYKFKSEP